MYKGDESTNTDSQKLSRVWEPIEVGGLTLNNRILQPAHSSQHGDPTDQVFSDRQIAYYRERAKGGVALGITETVAAARSAVGSFYNIVDVFNERCIPSMESLADAVHAYGGRIFVQLASMGVHDRGKMFIDRNKPLWGASRIPSLIHNEIPLVMGSTEIDELVNDFGVSASNVKRSGLDGVEIHGAHSYGLGQFMSPTYNKRDDDYGGSPAKRCRLVLEVAEAVRRHVGDDIVVGVRLSWDEFMGPEGGITPEQSEEQLELLADSGLFDYFSITAGGYHTIHLALASMMDNEPEGWLAPYSKRAKEIVGDRAKVFVVGKVRDLYTAERILAEGSADMVAIARQLLTDPFTVKKTREGREHEIIVCNRCNECAGRLFEHRELVCALNPVSGREAYWGDGQLHEVPSRDRKQILVVGGGPAGMKFAAVASKRGHVLTLVERSRHLGGHLRLHERLPGMGGWSIAIGNLEREVANADVDVRLDTDASIETIKAESADIVVIATGASYERTGQSLYRPEREKIPGTELDHVWDLGTAAVRALQDPKAFGERVLILDETGAHFPFALAELFAQAGVKVEIMSPRMYAGERLFRNLDMLSLFPRLKGMGIQITQQYFVEAIRDREVDVYDIWSGSQELEIRSDIDSVIFSVLRVPNDSLYHVSHSTLPDVRRIGDVLAPRDITAVLVDGEQLAREI